MNTLLNRLQGKLHAANTLYQFATSLQNWREVWSAYRRNTLIPPLRLRGGITLYHEPGDDTINLFREIFLDHCYTRHSFYRPRPGDTVMDLGANIGFFALYMHWRSQGVHVHCFEPGLETRRRLEHNIQVNGLESFIKVYPFAIADARRTEQLFQAPLLAQRSLFANEFHSVQAVENDNGSDRLTVLGDSVECIGLDEAVALTGSDKIDYLKMDIEGSEIEAVRGASQETWNRITRVVFEYHDRFRPGCRATVLEVLAAQGLRKSHSPMSEVLRDIGLVHVSR